MEGGWKPNVEISPNCPRCGSCYTKFCYYNNYSLTQPRYFCKGCRRYWTKGGSLRNVPAAGGGCRKNRRGKSLRLSTDGVQSRSLDYGYLPNGLLGYSYGTKGNSLVESTSSSMMPDGSHIDLALVYANFLNQKPDSKTGFELRELHSDLDSTLEFLSMSNTNLSSGTQLVEENGFCGCLPLSELSVEICPSAYNQMYFCGSDSTQKHQDRTEQSIRYGTSNCGLPPLPGEDIASRQVVWSSSQTMLNHTFQATQLPGLGPEAQDPNSLISNWSPFELSSDVTFSRT